MSIWSIIASFFTILFIISFVIMMVSYSINRKEAKELSTSVIRSMKKQWFSIGSLIILFAIMVSVTTGTTITSNKAKRKIHNIVNEQHLSHGILEATQFMPDINGKIGAKINTNKIYSDYKDDGINDMENIINYLYTGDPLDKSWGLNDINRSEIIREDFLLKNFDYSKTSGDKNSQNIFQVFFLLDKLSTTYNFSYKYQPYITGKLPKFSDVSDTGLLNLSMVKIIRDENAIYLRHKNSIHHPTLKHTNNYEVNTIKRLTGSSINSLKDDEASVGELFLSYSENMNMGDKFSITTPSIPLGHNFKVTSTSQTPQNIVPVALQSEIQLGSITHDMTTTMTISNDSFNDLLFNTSNRKGDIAIGHNKIYNSIKNEEFEFHSEEYKEMTYELNNILEDKLFNYIEPMVQPPLLPTSLETRFGPQPNETLLRRYDDKMYTPNTGIIFALDQLRTIESMTSIISVLFTIILIIVILIFIKRRVEDNGKSNMTLKSLGYASRRIGVLYIAYPVFIIVVGWLIGWFIGVYPIQLFWSYTMQKKVSFEMLKIDLNILLGLFQLFSWLILLSTFVFVVTTLMLKTNITQSLKGERLNKPNILVRKIGDKFHNLSFSNEYRIKNMFRQLSKSSFIFVSIIATMTVFVFGGVTNEFSSQSVKNTQHNFNFEIINWNKGSFIEESNPEVLDVYDFGGDRYNTTFVIDKNGNERLKEKKIWGSGTDEPYTVQGHWKFINKTIVKYMEEESLKNKKIAIESSDIVNLTGALFNYYYLEASEASKYTFSQYMVKSNRGSLILGSRKILNSFMNLQTFLEISEKKNDMQYWTSNLKKTNGDEYTGISLSIIHSKMLSMFLSQLINIMPSLLDKSIEQINFNDLINGDLTAIMTLLKILRELLDDSGLLINRQYVSQNIDKLSIGYGEMLDPISGNKMGGSITHIIEYENFNNYYSFLDIESNHHNPININDKVLSYDAGKAIPGFISYYDAKIMGLKEGDVFEYKLTDSLMQDTYQSDSVPVVVAGIYNAFFPIGIALWTGPTDVHKDESTTIAAQSLEIGYGYSQNDPSLNKANSIISKSWFDMPTYGTWQSQLFNESDTDWNLLTGNINDNQPISLIEDALFYPLPIQVVGSVVEILYKDFNSMIIFFIVLSFLISILLIIIVTKEIIDGTKNEVSTLKALGYGNLKSSSMVAESQVMMMFLSSLISIPITMMILYIFETLMFTQAGLVLLISANVGIILSFFSIFFFILIGIYLMIIALLKGTKATDSLKEI